MTLSVRNLFALTLAGLCLTGLVGCDDKKVAVPTKTDQPLPQPMTGGGGGKKVETGGPSQKAD